MVRTQRLEAPDAIHHVVPKGSGGRRIVEDDQDRRAFLGRFAAAARDCSWVSHSGCLMSTHHHAVVETPLANLGAGLKLLLGGYARSFNRRHGLAGNLFAQHCWSRRIVDDSQLFRACLYVVLNPVASGLCSHPRDWPWCSYTATAEGDDECFMPGEDRLLRIFGDTPGAARRRYAEVVDEAVELILARRIHDGAVLWRTLGELRRGVALQVSD